MTNHASISLKMLLPLLLSLTIYCAGLPAARAQGTVVPSVSSASPLAPIGAGDALNITVLGEADLTKTYTVDPSGNIEVPYIGKVHVGGLSLDQATALLQQKLGQIYTSPQVTISRPTLGGITVTIIGSVEHQGSEPLRRDAHLNDAVQLASPTADADIKHINVTSGQPGQTLVTQTFDLDSFLNGGVIDQNPPLHDGDTVFIPKQTQLEHSVSVTGEVTKPGRYNVAPGSTVFDLITLAGGLTTSADPTGVYIQALGTTTQVPVNYNTAAENPSNTKLNPILSDGDEVVVPLASAEQTYAITGAVLKPGTYPYKGVVSLLDAIANSGGADDRAKVSKTTITRSTPQGPVVITVNANDSKAAATTYLQANDVVNIPHGSPPTQQPSPFEVITGLLSVVDIFK